MLIPINVLIKQQFFTLFSTGNVFTGAVPTVIGTSVTSTAVAFQYNKGIWADADDNIFWCVGQAGLVMVAPKDTNYGISTLIWKQTLPFGLTGHSPSGRLFIGSNQYRQPITVLADPAKTPTALPTTMPTSRMPTVAPTTRTPTSVPTVVPSARPSATPSSKPTASPSAMPSAVPTATPSVEPTAAPSPVPTATPSETPTEVPTEVPTAEPSVQPTIAPSFACSGETVTTTSTTTGVDENGHHYTETVVRVVLL